MEVRDANLQPAMKFTQFNKHTMKCTRPFSLGGFVKAPWF